MPPLGRTAIAAAALLALTLQTSVAQDVDRPPRAQAAPAHRENSGSLPPPTASPADGRLNAPQGDSTPLGSLLPDGFTVLASLSFVLGLFLLLAWILRRSMPGRSNRLPTDVVEVLGRAPLASRQDVHLVRVGKKLLLVAVSTAGAETLTEISDVQEVDRLAGLCQQDHAFSSTNAFRQVMQQLSREPTHDGFISSAPQNDASSKALVGEPSDA